jgi:phenylalanine-4-hydroxylase
VYAIDSEVPNRIGFDLERVLSTEYRIDAFQESYFVIDSFEQLFAETHKPFGALYERLRNAPTIPPNAALPKDRILHRGAIAGRVC